jgi:signal transduction histidine kinase
MLRRRLRERVTLFGGELLARPTGQGGFLVRARLPLAGIDP